MAFDQLPINLAIEGSTDEIVLKHVLRYVGVNNVLPRGRKGKEYLLKNLDGFNQAARYGNKWLVVIDLDEDVDCAPKFIQAVLPHPADGMLLRMPVRAIESWLLGDRESFAQFLGIAIANLPLDPEQEIDPKKTLVDLVARKCRKTGLRQDILPDPKSGRKVGPGYASRITEFMGYWRPEVAAGNSDSLRRCIHALENWKMIGA